jgi:hypothetical protein
MVLAGDGIPSPITPQKKIQEGREGHYQVFSLQVSLGAGKNPMAGIFVRAFFRPPFPPPFPRDDMLLSSR